MDDSSLTEGGQIEKQPLESEPIVDSPPPEPPPLPIAPVNPALPFVFHGKAKEYFRIWIVNTLLTLLTGGVFLAWAKVRKRRYLRGSTELMGHRFDYRADPRRILFGNIIVFIFFMGYAVFGTVYPAIHIGAFAIGVILLPWVVVRSLTFNAHNTVYQGMRFRFNPSISASGLVYLLEPILIIITLGLYYPAWIRSKRAYVVNNHRLGDAYFRFNASNGTFYSAYLLGGLIIFGTAMVAAAILGLTMFRHPVVHPGIVTMIPFFILYGFGIFLGRQFIYARIFNHLWNHTRLDGHQFIASLKTSRWLSLQLGNLGAIIGTCGLLYPWSVIRTQYYVASCLQLLPAGPLNKIEALGGTHGSGVGDSAAEFIGLDFGL